MTPLRIAPTTQDDLPAILEMAGCTFREHRARNPRAFPDTTLLKLEERHRDAVDLAGDAPTSFVARRDDAVAGHILLRPINVGGMVYDIGVLPDHRQQGVGLALLEHATGIAKQRHWRALVATVWDGNDASHRLFQKANFTDQSLVPQALRRFAPRPAKTTYSIVFR